MQLSLKQVAAVADELLLRKTTAPGSSTVIAQVVLGQKTFTDGTEIDRTSDAPDTPGRFDSNSTAAGISVFGAEGVGEITAGIGFWGGDAEPTGSIWWVPDNPFNQDYGHFTLKQSRGSRGFDPVANSGVLTGPAGIEAYYLQVPMGRTTASPGNSPANYITDSGALWPPSEVAHVKLFSRPGPSPYYDVADLEPVLAVTTRDLAGTVRTENILTADKAAAMYAYAEGSVYRKTTDFTVDAPGIYVVYASPSPVMVTLPVAGDVGSWTVSIKRASAGAGVTVAASSPDSIDNTATYELSSPYGSVTLITEPSEDAWWVI